MAKFKKGDQVKLDPSKCSGYDKDRYGSTGEFGVTYEIKAITSTHDSYDYKFKGGNWHKESWLMLASLIRIGGE